MIRWEGGIGSQCEDIYRLPYRNSVGCFGGEGGYSGIRDPGIFFGFWLSDKFLS